MALQILFGDDEHTAADGPYLRVMKVRKWLYISSAIAIIFASGQYHAEKMAELFAPVTLPDWLLEPALAIGLVYLLAQYGLLIWQFRATYDLMLKERLRFRRVDDLKSAQLRIDEAIKRAAEKAETDFEKARTTARKRMDEIVQNQKDLDQLNARLYEVRHPTDDDGVLYSDEERDRHIRGMSDEIQRLKAKLKNLRRAAGRPEALPMETPDWTDLPASDATRIEVDAAQASYAELLSEDPASRPGYARAETLIDLLRVGIPPLTAMYALGRLAFSWA